MTPIMVHATYLPKIIIMNLLGFFSDCNISAQDMMLKWQNILIKTDFEIEKN